MDQRKSRDRLVEWQAAALIGLLLVCLCGCDHRISLQEFQTMQDGLQHEANPSQLPPAGADVIGAQLGKSMGPYKVGPNDVLAVTVTPAGLPPPMIPIQARVDTIGMIQLPMVGQVEVKDMTLAQVEMAVRAAYVPAYHVQATVFVQVAEAETADVMVVGAVMLPGLASLRRGERNVLYAMASAGGSTPTASGIVTLQRIEAPEEVLTLDLRDPEHMMIAMAIPPLANGDIVNVQASRSSTVFVGGLVALAGPQTYTEGSDVTVLQALAAAGGGRPDLIPTEATLIRRMNGKDVHVKLDLFRLVTGKDENIALASGDILWLPHTAGTRIHEFINNTVYLRVGAGYYLGYSNVGSDLRGDEKDREATTTIISGP